MASWEEALDVDDSDLRSSTVLRRCTQPRCSDQTIFVTDAATTITAYISQSQILDSSPSPSQTVNSLSQNLTLENQAQSPPKFCTIPGPAGIVQAAKLRKSRDSVNLLGQEVNPMATQEYIRKVVEDPVEDEDFKRNPWLSATEFLHDDGMFNSAFNLGEINKYQKNGKLDQVVAVIKSCIPNELGDMTVVLKDPTGTVSGTIHHKVLIEGDFRKGICVGSVLILHMVSVFSPSRSTHYLNITKRNLVKVFYKDGGSSEKKTFHRTIDAAPHYEDSGRGMASSGSRFSLQQGAEGITSRMKRRNTNNEQENMNHNKTSNKDTNLSSARDKETLKEANVIENVGQMSEYTNGIEGVKAFLPDWTDEQLLQISDWDDI